MSDDDSAKPTTEYLAVRLKRATGRVRQATGRVRQATGRFQRYVEDTVAQKTSCEETEEGAESEFDDKRPTALYGAVKPKPKAQPISDLGKDDEIAGREDDTAPSRARYLWAWLTAAAGLTAVLAVVGVVHPQGRESPASSASRPNTPTINRADSISASQDPQTGPPPRTTSA